MNRWMWLGWRGLGVRSLRLGLVAALGWAFLSTAAAQAPAAPRRVRVPRVLRVPVEFATIQSAIDAARDGQVVLVAPGTYRENLDFLGKAIEVIAPQGAQRTLILPLVHRAVVRFHHGEGPDSRLIGFTIRDGRGDFDSSAAGVSCEDPSGGPVAAPYLSDCILQNNSIDTDFGWGAGGISGNPILERCVLRQNRTGNYIAGGAVWGSPTLLSCVIEDNTACAGAGLRLGPASLVQDCILRRNGVGCSIREGPLLAEGGGVLAEGPGVVLERCLLLDNEVLEGFNSGEPGECGGYSRGGALAGAALLRRCTITGNRAELCARVGGIEGSSTLIDCILRGNDDPSGYYAGQHGFRFSDVEGGAPGAGSFDAEALFANAGAGDLRLLENSPCIDRGDPSSPLDPDGTRADVGALYHPQGNAPVGAVWRQLPSLTAASSSELGRSLAVSGSTLLVGGNGSAHVFERQGADWVETARLAPATLEPFDGFGGSADLDGNVAVVGAPGDSSGGSVYVYERRSPGAPFVETARLTVPRDDLGGFGSAVGLDGDLLVVGASGGLGLGSVLLFQRQGRGQWTQLTEFNPPGEPNGFYPEDSFGAAVDIQGTTIVVGAPFGGHEFLLPGAAFVYERAGSTPYSWVLVAELAPRDPQGFGLFGWSVSLSGETILVGASSGAHAFERSGPGLPWHLSQVLAPPDRPTEFVGEVLLVGDQAWLTQSPFVVVEPGATWEFARENAGAPWFEVARFAPSSGHLNGGLAFSEGTLFEGAASENPSGACHLFQRGPRLDRLALDQAADEEEVLLEGSALDEVTRVLVGGVEQAIVSQSAAQLVLRPERRDPGFADLTLETAGGAVTLARAFRSAPTLAARANGLGGTLEVELENGAPGAYVLIYSLDLRPTPFVFSHPPTWYGLFLGLEPGRFDYLGIDSFTSSGRAELSFDLPDDPALTGLPFHLQAWCRRGLFGPLSYSFTNAVSLGF